MIDQEREKLRAVAWSEMLPWLCLFRTFRLAIRIRALALGALAIVLTVVGWAILSWIWVLCGADGDNIRALINQVAPIASSVEKPVEEDSSGITLPGDSTPKKKVGPIRTLVARVPDQPGRPAQMRWDSEKSTRPVWTEWEPSRPFVMLFGPKVGFGGLLYLIVCGLWSVVVWAFCGGAITRSAALELAADERVGTRELMWFVVRRWRSYAAAPLFPLLGVLLAAAGVFVGGLFLNSGPSMWVAAILWPLVLLGGLMMAVLLLGLCFGWPLMWTTISSEGTDSFDALSRTYAYVFQKPLHYLFYVVVAAAFGALGWCLVANFAAAVIALSDWAASWGCGQERIKAIVELDSGNLGTIGYGAAWLIHVWRGCVKILAVGFVYSYFWTAATAVYFLMRRDVDATEMDEVFVDDERTGEIYGLPKIESDEQGAPTVSDSGQTQTAGETGDESSEPE